MDDSGRQQMMGRTKTRTSFIRVHPISHTELGPKSVTRVSKFIVQASVFFLVKVEYVSNNTYALSCSLALSGSRYSLDGY